MIVAVVVVVVVVVVIVVVVVVVVVIVFPVRDSVQSEHISVLGDSIVCFYLITPVLDQFRSRHFHLW